jgi:hypothetical protein
MSRLKALKTKADFQRIKVLKAKAKKDQKRADYYLAKAKLLKVTIT